MAQTQNWFFFFSHAQRVILISKPCIILKKLHAVLNDQGITKIADLKLQSLLKEDNMIVKPVSSEENKFHLSYGNSKGVKWRF